MTKQIRIENADTSDHKVRAWAQHKGDCEWRVHRDPRAAASGITWEGELPCTCGLDAALLRQPETPQPEQETRVDEHIVIPPDRATAAENETKGAYRERDIAMLRDTVSMLCNFIWTKRTRIGEHVWSIPADPERDFDFILSDAIDELEARRGQPDTRCTCPLPEFPNQPHEPACPTGQPDTPHEQTWQPTIAELRRYLDTLIITGDNIGEIRYGLFVPWDSKWNGIVRDETASREQPLPSPTHEQTGTVTLTEEEACADCGHQIYDHRGGACRVRRSSGVMCECEGFRFKNEGPAQ